MNIDTGELRRFNAEELTKEEQEELFERFRPVPEELSQEANALLGDKESVMVDMTKDTPLVQWANHTRKSTKEKHKAKIAKASKRKNRR